jgi:transposase
LRKHRPPDRRKETSCRGFNPPEHGWSHLWITGGQLFRRAGFLEKLFADGGHQGAKFRKGLMNFLPGLEIEIVKRSDHDKGVVLLPRRWIVERTMAWLNRCRRLAKDGEKLNRKALAFLRLASIRLMLRKLCNPI